MGGSNVCAGRASIRDWFIRLGDYLRDPACISGREVTVLPLIDSLWRRGGFGDSPLGMMHPTVISRADFDRLREECHQEMKLGRERLHSDALIPEDDWIEGAWFEVRGEGYSARLERVKWAYRHRLD